MFNVTKLSADSRAFLCNIASSGSRSIEVSIALARVIGNKLSIPTSATEDSLSFYRLNHQLLVDNSINEINELCLIDTKTVSDLVKNFYSYRYQTTYPEDHVLAFNVETAICDFFKLSKVFDKTTLAVIANNPVRLTDLVNKFSKLIEELKD